MLYTQLQLLLLLLLFLLVYYYYILLLLLVLVFFVFLPPVDKISAVKNQKLKTRLAGVALV